MEEYIKDQTALEPDDDFTVVQRQHSAEVQINPACICNYKPPIFSGGH